MCSSNNKQVELTDGSMFLQKSTQGITRRLFNVTYSVQYVEDCLTSSQHVLITCRWLILKFKKMIELKTAILGILLVSQPAERDNPTRKTCYDLLNETLTCRHT